MKKLFNLIYLLTNKQIMCRFYIVGTRSFVCLHITNTPILVEDTAAIIFSNMCSYVIFCCQGRARQWLIFRTEVSCILEFLTSYKLYYLLIDVSYIQQDKTIFD